MSLIASSCTGVSLLGKPAESYAYGIDFTCFLLLLLTTNIFVLNFVFMPVVANLNTTSLYEILHSSLTVLPPAFVINKFSDLDVHFLIIVLTAVTTICTMIGGFKGVVLTDTFQGFVLIFSIIILCVSSVVQVGGLQRVFEIAYSTERLTISKPSIDPTDRISIWSYLGFVHASSTLLLNQSGYQRMKALPSIGEMRIAMTWQLLSMDISALAACFVGLSIYAYYFGCDPKEAKLVNTDSDVVLHWLNEVGEKIPGFRGVYIAGITCASVSTMSTHLNTTAEIACKELLKKATNNHVRLATVAVGVLSAICAIFFRNSSFLVEMTHTFASLDGIISGLFILGMLVIPANSKGALFSGIFNMLTTLLFSVGSRYFNVHGSLKPYPTKPVRKDLCLFNVSRPIADITPPQTMGTVFYLFRISPFYYSVIAVFSTVVTGLVISLLFPDKTGKAHLFSPLVLRFLPRSIPISETLAGEVEKMIRSEKIQNVQNN